MWFYKSYYDFLDRFIVMFIEVTDEHENKRFRNTKDYVGPFETIKEAMSGFYNDNH